MPPPVTSPLTPLRHGYPASLVDRIVSVDAGARLIAVKNVTVSEDFFQGHFPGVPLMPGVLMVESLAQAAAQLLVDAGLVPGPRAFLRGVDRAKFRRQVVPGDRVRLEASMLARRRGLAKVRGVAFVGDHVVAEADLWLGIESGRPWVHADARVHPSAQVGDGTIVEARAVVGPHVRLGRDCRVGVGAIVDGWTEVGDGTEIFPYASIGLAPQDLKYQGEPTRLVIGRKNVFREFVTIHRGTAGGGGVTSIGDRNLFMAYAHVAHDCHVGDQTIFGNAATLGGHVSVDDFATVSAFSGVHQFCRIGRYAFIGGFSVVTKDALPFAKTVGNRARVYGLNRIGLVRRGFSPATITALRRAYRILLQSKLNTSSALAEIERDEMLSASPEVGQLVTFIRTSTRGVTLRRGRRADDSGDDE